jgi:hypothetical protein
MAHVSVGAHGGVMRVFTYRQAHFAKRKCLLVSLTRTEGLCRHYQLSRPPFNTMRSSLCTRKQGSETLRKRDDGRQCDMPGFCTRGVMVYTCFRLSKFEARFTIC